MRRIPLVIPLIIPLAMFLATPLPGTVAAPARRSR